MGGCERCWLAMWVDAISCFLVSSALSDPWSLSVLGGGGHLVVNILEVTSSVFYFKNFMRHKAIHF